MNNSDFISIANTPEYRNPYSEYVLINEILNSRQISRFVNIELPKVVRIDLNIEKKIINNYINTQR